MTLLTICQDAAVEMDLIPPTAVMSANYPEVQKLRRYANKVGRRLVREGDWQILRATRTFTALSTEVQTGILPADFGRFVPQTMWDRTNTRLITGPINALQYQSNKATIGTNAGWNKWFTQQGNAVSIYPLMAGGETITFDYRTLAFCESSGGTAQTSWLADTDVPRLPEELFTLGIIAEYLNGEGQPSQRQWADFTAAVKRELDNDKPTAGTLSAGDIFGGPRAFPGTPAAGASRTWGY